jgi:preprotein translocase SecE subunit
MKAIDYIKSTKEEMKHVKWPTRKETILYTVAVILISGVVAYVLGFFDYLFSLGLEKLLSR